MYTEKIGFRIEVLEDGQIQVCQVTHVLKDGVEIAATNHRHVIHPGQNFSNENAVVRHIAAAVHTPDVIKTWDAARAMNSVVR